MTLFDTDEQAIAEKNTFKSLAIFALSIAATFVVALLAGHNDYSVPKAAGQTLVYIFVLLILWGLAKFLTRQTNNWHGLYCILTFIFLCLLIFY